MLANILTNIRPIPFLWRMLRWHLGYLSARTVRPLGCGLYVTSRCNFRCVFCNIWRLEPSFTLDHDIAKDIVRRLGDLGLIYFSVSGGEPLLVPYTLDILKQAKRSGILYTHLVSNGSLMDRDRARSVAAADLSEVSFSIDGPKEIHDAKRGMPGAFEGVISAVDNVKTCSPKTRIVLNTILTVDHPEHALSAVNTAGELKVLIKIQPRNQHPLFQASDRSRSSKMIAGQKSLPSLRSVLGILEKTPHLANSGPFLRNYRAFLHSPENNIFARRQCIFGYHHVEIFNNQIFPCLEGLDWTNGFELGAKDLGSLLASPEYSDTLERLRRCEACSKTYYVCYYEPRLNFPVWNFLLSRLSIRRTARPVAEDA